jgi:hypothetical protein
MRLNAMKRVLIAFLFAGFLTTCQVVIPAEGDRSLVSSTVPNLPQSGLALEGCPILPPDNIWNTSIDQLPVDLNSASYINSIGASGHLHPDFGSGTWDGFPIGIPYNVVDGNQVKSQVAFYYPDESDPGPYPIPPNPKIEGDPTSGDRHILILDRDHCMLYELYDAWYDNGWQAGSGAIFDLNSNALRPSRWTSADAAGLPILPGLVRYDEVMAGEINHALRFTVSGSQAGFIWPARHQAPTCGSTDCPPMGQRFRLKADYDLTGYSPPVVVILRALQKYGMIVADNGSSWFISGVPDERWDNDMLVSELHSIPGSAFEAVDESSLMVDPDSGRVNQTKAVYSLFIVIIAAP